MSRLQQFKAWITNEKRMVWVEYSGLALAIMLPLLLPGYILTLDLVFTPHFAWPNEITNTYPLQVLLWLLYHVLPGDIIEKLILFTILLLSGVGMHKFIRRIKVDDILGDIWRLAAYFGGTFYMINPFTYSRFMAGQWMVLLGYALLPFFLLAVLKFVARPTVRTALKPTIWALVISFVSVHHIGIAVLLGLIVLAVGVGKYWSHTKRVITLLGLAAAGGLGVLIISSFWVIPAFLGHNSIGQAVADFNQTDTSAFVTSGHGSLGAIGDVVRLQGFWAGGRELYRLPQSLIPLWGLIFLLVWLLVGIGAVKAWRHHRSFVVIALSCIGVGILLATTPLLSWLSQHFSMLMGYREPHKFVNLVALGYALLGAFGAAYIAQWMSDRYREKGAQTAISVCVLLVFLGTPTMMWGFAGQLSPRTYPPEWVSMNQILKETIKVDEKVLFLPWHQYSSYSFSGRLIANPAEKFFEVPIVASDQPEFRGISPTVPNEEKRRITEALGRSSELSRVLKEGKISYILLAKEKDVQEYIHLNTSKEFKAVSENAKLKLYKLE